MITIHKYTLDVNAKYACIASYEGMLPLHVGCQNDSVCLWAEVDTNAPEVAIAFQIVGTGMSLPSDNYSYVGTALVQSFVWHVYINMQDLMK